MTTITIHEGELLKIKSIITQTEHKKRMNIKGSLHGLYSESYQPVILIVCGGDNKKTTEEMQEYAKKHKMTTLGEWIVSDSGKAPKISRKTVTVLFDKQGERISAYHRGEPALLEILKGQSAFRQAEELKLLAGFDGSPIKIESEDEQEDIVQREHQVPVPQSRTSKDHIIDVKYSNDDVSCHTHTSQWYNTDRDTLSNTFEFVRRTFADDKKVEISRNTSTENMKFMFRHSQYLWVIEFPAEFPKGVVKLRKINGNREKDLIENVSLKSADLARMKNTLKDKFVKMCNCAECSNREPEEWV